MAHRAILLQRKAWSYGDAGQQHVIYFNPVAAFPTACASKDGHITMPDLPGIGFESKFDLYKEMRVLSA